MALYILEKTIKVMAIITADSEEEARQIVEYQLQAMVDDTLACEIGVGPSILTEVRRDSRLPEQLDIMLDMTGYDPDAEPFSMNTGTAYTEGKSVATLFNELPDRAPPKGL